MVAGGDGARGGQVPLRQDAVLRSFLDARGRLLVMPTKLSQRLVVLDYLAQMFEPGERYPEAEVNRRLRQVNDDVAAVRRVLIEEGFLDREAGIYWRIGGSVADL